MFKLKKRDSMIAKNPFPSPDSTCPSDSENDIAHELEQKRQQLERDVALFQAQKEKEFREFEQQLRLGGRKERRRPTPKTSDGDRSSTKERPKRASSSSALELLVGHGIARPPAVGASSSKTQRGSQPRKKGSISSQPGACPSKPTLSLEPLNIEGKTLSPSEAKGPSTPTILSRSLSQSSFSSATSGSSMKSSLPSPQVNTPSTRPKDPFIGIITPSFLPLLGSDPSFHTSSASLLVTPPIDEDNSHSGHRGLTGLPNGIIPLQSSSFPPLGTKLLAPSGTSKRSYTAPSASRMPSALRTASATNIAKKRKHVTLRLADSAIVNPSSSYEEGPSPLGSNERPSRTKPASAMSHSSKKPASLRYSNVGMRNGLISDHARSDEEDEAAGVKPGMSMDEVMQKLNEFNATQGNDETTNFTFDDDEDVGWTDTKYHEDEEEEKEEEDDGGDDSDDNDDHEDSNDDSSEDEPPAPKVHESEEYSYFSPRFSEISTMPMAQISPATGPFHMRDRSGSSPLTPVRDQDWESLSSSDKDRLLFSRRTSDDSDSDYAQRRNPSAARHPHSLQHRTSSSNSSLSGLKKSGSTNSLGSLTSLAKKGANQQRAQKRDTTKPLDSALGRRSTKQRYFEDSLGPSIDGGSGVGFFELDEELASPNAGKPSPFAIDPEGEAESEKGEDEEQEGGRMETKGEINGIKSGFSGASSVPIDIVRPSASVSSSWVGTFGH